MLLYACPTNSRPCDRNNVGHHDTRRAEPPHHAARHDQIKMELGGRLHYCKSGSQAAFLPFFVGTGSAFFTGRGSASTFSTQRVFLREASMPHHATMHIRQPTD